MITAGLQPNSQPGAVGQQIGLTGLLQAQAHHDPPPVITGRGRRRVIHFQ